MIRFTLLGTAGAIPLPDRALTAAVLNCNGHTILFDCGEGTQTAARKAQVSLMKCEIIALTHFHGDHIFGIPGLLQTMNCLGRQDSLTITGPKGLVSAMEPILKLSGDLAYEIILAEAPDKIVIPDAGTLKSFRTRHKGESCGYIFSKDRCGKFLIEEAIRLGVDKKDWGKLQSGQSVGNVMPEMVLGEKRKGLKVVFSGDSMPCDELKTAADDADIFICEATFPSDDQKNIAAQYGHMTFSQACDMGKGAKLTVLAHFSQRIEDPNEHETADNVVIGTDGMQFELEFDKR